MRRSSLTKRGRKRLPFPLSKRLINPPPPPFLRPSLTKPHPSSLIISPLMIFPLPEYILSSLDLTPLPLAGIVVGRQP